MICAWCGVTADSYEAHFASYLGRPCRHAALTEQPVTKLDAGLGPDAAEERDQIRRSGLRKMARARKNDRLELAPLDRADIRRSEQHLAQRRPT